MLRFWGWQMSVVLMVVALLCTRTGAAAAFVAPLVAAEFCLCTGDMNSSYTSSSSLCVGGWLVRDSARNCLRAFWRDWPLRYQERVRSSFVTRRGTSIALLSSSLATKVNDALMNATRALPGCGCQPATARSSGSTQ